MIHLLDNLTLPALVVLKIDRIRPPTEEDSMSVLFISHLITRSSCKLKELDLQVKNLDEDEFLTIMNAVPTLHRLSLVVVRGLNNSIIRRLEYSEHRPCLLPYLKRIDLLANSIQPSDHAALISVLAPRLPAQTSGSEGTSGTAVCPLEIAQIDEQLLDNKKTTSSLQTLREAGLHIRVDYTTSLVKRIRKEK